MPEVVDDEHVRSSAQERLDAMYADKPGTPGHDNSLSVHHPGHQFLLISARRKSAVLAGRSAMRRMRYPYHCTPNGT